MDSSNRRHNFIKIFYPVQRNETDLRCDHAKAGSRKQSGRNELHGSRLFSPATENSTRPPSRLQGTLP